MQPISLSANFFFFNYHIHDLYKPQKHSLVFFQNCHHASKFRTIRYSTSAPSNNSLCATSIQIRFVRCHLQEISMKIFHGVLLIKSFNER